MKGIRAIIGFFGILATAFVLEGCDSSGDDGTVTDTSFHASAEFSYSVTVTGHAAFRLDAVNGTVAVRGSREAGSVIVEGERRVGSDSQSDAAEYLRQLTVAVTESGDEVIVRTEQPNDARGREFIVEYEITLPADLEIEVNLINGTVELEDIESSVSVDLTNGILASDVDIPADGTIDMTVINGTLTLQIPITTSAIVDADVINGGLHVSNLDFVSQQLTSRSLTGTLGDGEGSIRLAVINGILALVGRAR